MKSFILRSTHDMIACLNLIEEHGITDPPIEVVVSEYKADRTAAQRRLQWLWNTQIGKHMGHGKNEIHLMMKELFAVPIFTRDDQGYAEMVSAVKAVRRAGMNAEADHMKREIVRLTSTEDFNTKQCAEYLTDMEHFAAEKGAEITFPADIYNLAMGRKK